MIAPLALAVPAAHADTTYTGTVDSSDPVGDFLEPDPVADRCVKADPEDAHTNYDTVSFRSQSAGPRRIVIRGTGATPIPFAIWAYRNGTCVAADYQPDNSSEGTQGIVDLDGVVFAVGDTVTLRFIALGSPGITAPWRLEILQPGTANAAAVGRARRT